MQTPTMLYRSPGPHRTDGVDYEYTIVDESEVEATLAAGWFRRFDEAGAAATSKDAERLAANEAEQADIAQKLEAAQKSKKVKA